MGRQDTNTFSTSHLLSITFQDILSVIFKPPPKNFTQNFKMSAFKHFAQAQTKYEVPLLANENAYLGDVHTSDKDATNPISAGFFRLKKGTPLVYTYKYDESKIILEGTFILEDSTGQKVEGKPGDVFFIPKGTTITFTTPDEGLAYYTGARKYMDV